MKNMITATEARTIADQVNEARRAAEIEERMAQNQPKFDQ